MVQALKVSFFFYRWNHTPAEGVPLTRTSDSTTEAVAGPVRGRTPEEFWQNTPAVRYELSWTKGDHDIKVGGEHLHWVDDGSSCLTENVGYHNDIRGTTNFLPRLEANYDVTWNADFPMRGGTGYYMVQVSELAFGYQMLSCSTGSACWPTSGATTRLPSFETLNPEDPRICGDVRCGPQRGVTGEDVVAGRVPLPPQATCVIAHDYELPDSWQSTVAFQKQIKDPSALRYLG